MNELSEIIITIDTREKSQKRISSVEQWGLKHGAVVEHQVLDLCDYHIEGSFHNQSFNTDVDINLGIEAKSISDFATSYNELPHKLASAFKQYQDVALFIEMGNYTFNVDSDDFHATIVNPAVRTGDANVLPLAVMEGILESIQTDGVHVRQLRSEAHFPYAIANLLLYISKPYHSGLHIDNDQDFQDNYLNVLAKIPGIGYKSGLKLIQRYPNLSWLTSADVSAYQEALGKLKGKILDLFVHNHSLETDEWRTNYFKNGSEIQPCSNCHSKQCQCISKIPSHTATAYLQNTTYSEVAGDRRGSTITPPTPTPPADTISKPKMAEQLSNDVESLAPPGFDSRAPPSNDKKCQFADEKKRFECKTPDHFKNPSHSITKGLQNMDDQQGELSPPMIGPADTSDISYTGGYTECIPKSEEVQVGNKTIIKTTYHKPESKSEPEQGPDPSSINTNTRCSPGPDTIYKSKTTHKMSLKHHLIEWFENPHTLQETVDAYGMKQEMGVGAWSGDRIFNMVVNSEKQGILRSYPHNGTKMYVLAVKPDIDLDIGV